MPLHLVVVNPLLGVALYIGGVLFLSWAAAFPVVWIASRLRGDDPTNAKSPWVKYHWGVAIAIAAIVFIAVGVASSTLGQ